MNISLRDSYLQRKREFNDTLESSCGLSESNIGIFHTGRQNRVLAIFSQMISHGLAVGAMTDFLDSSFNGFLNHFSIIAVARSALDSAVMCAYISEKSLSEDQWRMRWEVLRLHDLCNRKRFISSVANIENVIPNYDASKAAMQGEIMRLGRILGVEASKIHDLTKGNAVFINGYRGAVREAGFDVKNFEFWQAYFSAFTHSHPVSFMRHESHQISFDMASDYQINIVTFVLGVLIDYFAAVNSRVNSFCSVGGDPLGDFWVTEPD